MKCPLCESGKSTEFDRDKFRTYLRCSLCELIFVPRDQLISSLDEKNRYDAHENDADDQGYINYLKGISESVKSHLLPNEGGLDFGCGRTKLLAELLKPHGVSSYDLYFHPDEELLTRSYDFVILSEVIEHLRSPRVEMQTLARIGSKIFVKTKWYPEAGFSQWFYKRDITHVQFFNETSFRKLAEIMGFKKFEEVGQDLYLFTK